ncbi:MAG: right-handed parallel beta-helix repeat-containing protein [Verrucomicrobiota bacterium]
MCAVVAISSPCLVAGATKYVSKTGNNNNNGSASSPWRNIWYAVKHVGSGDTIRVKPGWYVENQTINIYISNLTIIADDPNNRPTVDFNDQNGVNDRKIWVSKAGVTWDGVNIQEAGNFGIWTYTGADNFTLKNCKVQKCYKGAIKFENNNGGRVENCTITKNGQINADRSGTLDWPHAVAGRRADDVHVKNCQIYRNHGEGVGPFFDCREWVIQGNTVYDNFSVNIYIDTSEGWCTVQNNLVYYTGYSIGSNDGNKPTGIRIANEAADFPDGPGEDNGIVEHINIRNNIILDCKSGIQAFAYAPGYKFKLKNSKIENNTIVRVQDNKLGLWISAFQSNVSVFNNIVWNTSGISLASGINKGDNFTQDPKFITGTGTSANNYKLKSSSPCRNTGTTLSSVGFDYWWQSRPRGGAFDIGADEY